MDRSTKKLIMCHFLLSQFSLNLSSSKRKWGTTQALLCPLLTGMSLLTQKKWELIVVNPLYQRTNWTSQQSITKTILVLVKKCKLYRDKPIEERQAYVKEHHICYRCCGSIRDFAKDCKAAVRCIECDSPKHTSAMHPDPTPAPKSTILEDGDSEEQTENSLSVVLKCTEVCGKSNSPSSCSKISLDKVYPAGHKEKAIKMYAVIYEQSNRSLAKSEFF